MTNRRLWALRALCLSLPALLLLQPCAAAEELPPGVVAEVRGQKLTFDGFCVAATQHATAEMKRSRSGPRAVLEQLIEELMVQQECRKLGLEVTKKDVDDLWRTWDTKLRNTSGGTRTLRDEIQDRNTTESEFVEQMWHILRKERIAGHPKYLGKLLPADEKSRLNQIGIVIATVRKGTKVEYGVRTIDHVQQKEKPSDLGPGVVARVNGEPITSLEFGRALLIRLNGMKVREYLDKECKTALLTIQGVRLAPEELDAEVEYLRKLWPLERELQRDEVWRTVTFEDRFETQFNMAMDDVRKSRYSLGLLGLVRNMRPTVTEAEIQAEFEAQKDGRYGRHILVYDIEIEFAQEKGLMANQGLPSRRDALEIGNKLSAQLGRGDSFDKVANDVNTRRNAWMQAKRIRLYYTDEDITLRQQAERMRDGDISSPFDTLSEVHVMKRVGLRPARTLEEVRPHVLETLARRKAREWIEEKLKDPAWVKLRWPLPERK